MTGPSTDFQDTLKRMLSMPPKENKTLREQDEESSKRKVKSKD